MHCIVHGLVTTAHVTSVARLFHCYPSLVFQIEFYVCVSGSQRLGLRAHRHLAAALTAAGQ
eukprot:5201874-Karenia_brevis.AAC.1